MAVATKRTVPGAAALALAGHVRRGGTSPRRRERLRTPRVVRLGAHAAGLRRAVLAAAPARSRGRPGAGVQAGPIEAFIPVIMIVVFAAFVLSPERMLQQFGLGLAAALLLGAVVIRCLIVPAVMQLLGRRAWWLTRPLSRLLPKVELEHH